MTPTVELWNRLATTWAELAWAVTWQSAILIGLFALATLALRRSSPSLRYGLWQVASVKLLVMPFWTMVILLPPSLHRDRAPAEVMGADSQTQAGSIDWQRVGSPSTHPGPFAGGSPGRSDRAWGRLSSVDWRAWLMLAWSLGIIARCVAIFRQKGRLDRLLRRSMPAGDPALLEAVTELSRRIGLRHPPRTLFVDGIVSPFVCGLRSPVLVLPSGLESALEITALRAVLLHELAHIRRRDLLWDWIPTIARLVYWFHPAVHYVSDRARLERELACDQAAMVHAGQDAAGYASILVDVVSRLSRRSGGGIISCTSKRPNAVSVSPSTFL